MDKAIHQSFDIDYARAQSMNIPSYHQYRRMSASIIKEHHMKSVLQPSTSYRAREIKSLIPARATHIVETHDLEYRSGKMDLLLYQAEETVYWIDYPLSLSLYHIFPP